MASFVSLLTILLRGGFASGRQKNYPTANDKRWEAFKPWLHFRLSCSILHKRVSWAATACPNHTQYILTFHQTIRNPFTMFICSSNPPPENALHVVDQINANTKRCCFVKRVSTDLLVRRKTCKTHPSTPWNLIPTRRRTVRTVAAAAAATATDYDYYALSMMMVMMIMLTPVRRTGMIIEKRVEIEAWELWKFWCLWCFLKL